MEEVAMMAEPMEEEVPAGEGRAEEVGGSVMAVMMIAICVV